MRVNNVSNFGFTRGIEIISNKNGFNKNKVDKSIVSVIDTISGKETSIFDEETSVKIGEFLRGVIGDYDVKSGVYKRRIDGRNYIFTGEDARKARRFERNAVKEKQKLGSGAKSAQYRCIELSRDEEMLKLVENGRRKNQPKTLIKLEFTADDALKRIRYDSSKNDGRTSSMVEKTLAI